MFRLIKYTIGIGLMIGIVFLGFKIYKKSLEMETNLADQKTRAKKKIAALEKRAVKKARELGNVYRKINDSINNGEVKQAKIQADKETKKETVTPPPAIVTRDPAFSLKPIDEEDRKVTTEVFAEVSDKKQAPAEDMAQSEFRNQPLLPENVLFEEEPIEPLDIKRVTEIRNVYSKAIETLNLK